MIIAVRVAKALASVVGFGRLALLSRWLGESMAENGVQLLSVYDKILICLTFLASNAINCKLAQR